MSSSGTLATLRRPQRALIHQNGKLELFLVAWGHVDIVDCSRLRNFFSGGVRFKKMGGGGGGGGHPTA